ncbi:MAG TPA: hypothetical protein VIK55_14075 [Paludibacter sp.]
MDQSKIIKELLELGGSLERIQKRVQELLKEFDIPEPNPRKRRNLKKERMQEIENYLDARRFKKQQQKGTNI